MEEIKNYLPPLPVLIVPTVAVIVVAALFAVWKNFKDRSNRN